jgi:hypothetical protein
MVASTQNADGVTVTTTTPDLRLAKIDDIGIVHRVVVTCGNEGFVFTNHCCYDPDGFFCFKTIRCSICSIGVQYPRGW